MCLPSDPKASVRDRYGTGGWGWGIGVPAVSIRTFGSSGMVVYFLTSHI